MPAPTYEVLAPLRGGSGPTGMLPMVPGGGLLLAPGDDDLADVELDADEDDADADADADLLAGATT